MPQVLLLVDPSVVPVVDFYEKDLGKALIKITEKIFGIQGKDDVALTRIDVARTINEASLQVKVRYTAGKDEYGRGHPFHPSPEKQDELASVIISETKRCLGEELTVSAWIIPVEGSVFREG